MEENNVVVNEEVETTVDLTGMTTKELTKELARRGKTKAKSGAGKAKKWALRVLAIGGAAAGGVAVGYHLKKDSEEEPMVMYPLDDGCTTGTTVGDILNDDPTTENEN